MSVVDEHVELERVVVQHLVLDDLEHPGHVDRGAVTDDGGAAAAVVPDRPVRLTLKGIASLVAPASLVTALLFYFGWARTNAQAQLLGLDYSLFDFSTQEYLLRSIDPMYWPLFVGSVVALAGLAFHAGVVSVLRPTRAPDGRQRMDERWRGWLVALEVVLAVLGLSALVLGLIGANVDRPSRLVSLWSPVSVTVAIVLLGYAFVLVVRFGLRRPVAPGAPAMPTEPAGSAGASAAGGASGELAALRLWGEVVLVVLVLLSLFWSVSRYAQIKGFDLALAVERGLPGLPDAVVYSDKRLHLPLGVAETELSSPDDSAYRFRYSRLKLVFRSGNHYFLRPSDPSVSNVNIIIGDSPSLRFEFARG